MGINIYHKLKWVIFMNFILDIAVVFIVVSLALTNYRRGLINSVIDFAGTIISVVAASLVGTSVSIWIYNQFIVQKITDSVNQALTSTVQPLSER